MTKMKVLNEKVLVRVAVEEEKTQAGIILSTAEQERKYEGWVEDVGTNPDIAAAGVRKGVYVFYPKGLNTEVVVDDVIYDVVSIYDVLAVGEEE